MGLSGMGGGMSGKLLEDKEAHQCILGCKKIRDVCV
jgi:hypothetical protein